MTILLSIYIPLLLLVLVYVAINAYHLINFRLPIKGDVSHAILAIYLIVVASLLVGSIIFAIAAYYGFQ